MLIKIIPRDDETGILDDEFRDGDIQQVYDDTFESSLGTLEKKTSLFIKIPDPPNYATVKGELVKQDFALGQTFNEAPVVRNKRRYRINWRQRFNATEIALIEAVEVLPDGATSQGGTVTAGVVSGLFSASDFIRK